MKTLKTEKADEARSELRLKIGSGAKKRLRRATEKVTSLQRRADRAFKALQREYATLPSDAFPDEVDSIFHNIY